MPHSTTAAGASTALPDAFAPQDTSAGRALTPASPPLEELALVGDLRSSALLDAAGTVVWGGGARPDSAPHFARLLGDATHGHWTLGPATGSSRADSSVYDGESLVLTQTWTTGTGTLRVTTFMPPYQRDESAGPRLVRTAEVLQGYVSVRSVFAPRFDYGRAVPYMWPSKHSSGGRRVVATAGPASLWLDVTATGRAADAGDDLARIRNDAAAVTSLELHAGETVHFATTWQDSHLTAPAVPDPAADLQATYRFWDEWTNPVNCHSPHRDAVTRALITLKSLTYAPTGAVIAAPTTSLPELLGGARNWDYRYTWLRDSALILTTLLRRGHLEETRAWLGWLVRAVAGDVQPQIMYGVGGERDLPEFELAHLPGYECSVPVRVGNAAASQLQLDVFGEVLELMWLAHRSGIALDDATGRLWVAMVHRLEDLWEHPDEGIWEVRGPRRHFVHSKVMAWTAFDRALDLASETNVQVPQEVQRRWAAVRDRIHAEVCERGYDPRRNTFTQSYGSTDLDASLLLMLRTGFLPVDDKRVIGTVEAIQRELAPGGRLVLRYPVAGHEHGDENDVDGLPGGEGAFLPCSFWLADALALIGRHDEATALFERLLALRGPAGLLSEEWDEQSGRQVGNTPQGLTMCALSDTEQLLTELTDPRQVLLPRQADGTREHTVAEPVR
ncbi:glycoside hydrolase family 15 protein [Kitasatospora indigofera]|uniref:glycoside hydrolase family 15 protein n=1 Tax=Kitasatospora indigofera TaxID=67307 RepID=UPI00367A377B